MKISGTLVRAVALSALMSSAMTPANAADDSADKMVKLRINSDLRSIDPGVNRDLTTDIVLQHTLEGLVAFREDGSTAPMLAKSIDMSEDGTVYTFTLRDDVVFHNGKKMTIDDVMFSWNRYMDPATNWFCRPQFASGGPAAVKSVEAVGNDKLVFTLEQPSGLFLFNLARFDCGSTAVYHRDSIGSDGVFKELIATGPFRMTDWRRGQYIEFSRFDDYSALPGEMDGYAGNKAAKVGKARFVIIPDAAAAKTALLAGDLDIDWQIDESQVADYKSTADVNLETFTSMNLAFLFFQTRSPRVSDVRIRQAVEKSIDFEQLVAAVTSGEGTPSRSMVPQTSPYYKEAQAVVPKRDLEGARKLLAEAGYKGEPIKLVTSKQFPEFFNVAIVAQAMALEAGINIQIDVTDWATHGDRLRRGDYEMMSFGYGARIDPSIYYDAATGDKDKEPNKVWDSPEAREIIYKSMRVADPAERQKIFDELEAKFRADLPIIPLYSRVVTSAMRKNVEGYKPRWTLGLPRLWSVSIN